MKKCIKKVLKTRIVSSLSKKVRTFLRTYPLIHFDQRSLLRFLLPVGRCLSTIRLFRHFNLGTNICAFLDFKIYSSHAHFDDYLFLNIRRRKKNDTMPFCLTSFLPKAKTNSIDIGFSTNSIH